MPLLDTLIITGASRGMGLAIAKDLAPDVRQMILCGSSGTIQDVAKTMTSHGAITTVLQHDFSDLGGLVQKAHETIRPLSVHGSLGIVLAAGQIGEPGGILNADLNAWDSLFRINTLANLAIVQAALPLIQQSTHSRIVFFAGGGAAYGYPLFGGYALSKVAVVRAVENLAAEFSEQKLDHAAVVALAPGAVATDMLAKVEAAGGEVRTRTDINEPVQFVRRYCTDETCPPMSGRFVHVRDDLTNSLKQDDWYLRRIT